MKHTLPNINLNQLPVEIDTFISMLLANGGKFRGTAREAAQMINLDGEAACRTLGKQLTQFDPLMQVLFIWKRNPHYQGRTLYQAAGISSDILAAAIDACSKAMVYDEPKKRFIRDEVVSTKQAAEIAGISVDRLKYQVHKTGIKYQEGYYLSDALSIKESLADSKVYTFSIKNSTTAKLIEIGKLIMRRVQAVAPERIVEIMPASEISNMIIMANPLKQSISNADSPSDEESAAAIDAAGEIAADDQAANDQVAPDQMSSPSEIAAN